MAASEHQRGLSLPRAGISVVLLLALVGLIAWVVWSLRSQDQPADRSFALVYPRRETIVATVNATGQIAPTQVANLGFTAPGRVSEVLVQAGDRVAQGAALARIDPRELRLRVSQAEAQLAQSQASYASLLAGADPEELAAAEAQLRQAQAQSRQATGSVTEADLRAAEAQLIQAQEQLGQLLAGADPNDLRTAEAQLAQAEAQLASQRDQLSASKTNAQLQLEQAVANLTQAQSRYSTARWNWEYVQRTGNDPLNPSVPDPQRPGEQRANQLNPQQQQQYYDVFVQAEAALRTAESNVEQARVAYDTARQAEVTGIAAAEQQVVTARANLAKLVAGPNTDQIAAARAQVASARANLDKLRGDQRLGALEAAQAAVDQAAANLERLRTGPDENDLAVAQAQVASAQANLNLARLALDEATLIAPFAGTVAEVNLQVGEVPAATQPAIVLADLSAYHVDVTVDEIDVPQLAVGQPVTLTLDALPDLALGGAVESIAPLSTAGSALTAYRVRIAVPAIDPRIRPGMSTTADIVVAQKERALLVPRRAVRNDRGTLVVDIVRDQSICANPDSVTTRPELLQRRVETGLSNEQVIEIVDGLDEQTCIFVEGIDPRFNPFGGPPRPR